MDFLAAAQAIGNAITSVSDIIKPYEDEHFAQLYDKEHTDRMGQYGEILAETDNTTRANELNDFILHLLSSAGATPGGVSGTSIEVPLDAFNELVQQVSLKIKEDSMLAKIQFKENK